MSEHLKQTGTDAAGAPIYKSVPPASDELLRELDEQWARSDFSKVTRHYPALRARIEAQDERIHDLENMIRLEEGTNRALNQHLKEEREQIARLRLYTSYDTGPYHD